MPAVIAFSVIYGVLHLLNPSPGMWGILNTVLIGVLLSIAYLRTRALWLPWGIHFGWNLTLGLLFGLPLSGFRNYNLLRYTQAYGPDVADGRKIRHRGEHDRNRRHRSRIDHRFGAADPQAAAAGVADGSRASSPRHALRHQELSCPAVRRGHIMKPNRGFPCTAFNRRSSSQPFCCCR